jgi:hypothetical protein
MYAIVTPKVIHPTMHGPYIMHQCEIIKYVEIIWIPLSSISYISMVDQ